MPGKREDEPTQWSLTLYRQTPSSPPIRPIGFELLTVGDVLSKQYEELAEKHTERDAKSVGFGSRAVVACWDLITQERVGKGVIDVAEEQRKPVKVRSDRRREISDDGTVRLVSVRGRQASVPRPRSGKETDSTEPGRRYDRGRWMVHEHTRDHCMNPAAHSSGGCTHQDITILDYPKGPPDKPFLDTVYVVKGE
ncbi:hypothetical protein ACFY5H_33515 [Streptomyces sp. NPDC013012]|uniref:hypothetical protein n=1 Tax=Streptomyces sp. NPDC013012 TaxID=3364860 RepID=UPI0036A38C8F